MHVQRIIPTYSTEYLSGPQYGEGTAGGDCWALIKVPRRAHPARRSAHHTRLALMPTPGTPRQGRGIRSRSPGCRLKLWLGHSELALRRGPRRVRGSELRIQTTWCVATLQRWGYFGRAIILARELANYRGDALLFVSSEITGTCLTREKGINKALFFLGNHWYMFDKRKKRINKALFFLGNHWYLFDKRKKNK